MRNCTVILLAVALLWGPGSAWAGPSVAEAQDYIRSNEGDFKRALKKYTERTRVLNTSSPRRQVTIHGATVESANDTSVFVEVDYEFGSKTWSSNNARGTFLFEMQWDGGDLIVVGHEER